MYKKNIFLLFFFLLIVVSCKKDKIKNPPGQEVYSNGLLVLCEGLFHQNNSSLAWVNLETEEVTKNIFQEINGRPLGDIANDMLVYGSKIYIAVTTSSTVEVLDEKSLKSIHQISMNYNNKAQQPRYLAADNGQVFISSFDGYVTIIDTLKFQVKKRIKVGRNPEGICIANHSLYVANSGGLDPNNLDSTVMEIQLSSLEVVDTFVVGKNPGRIIAGNDGNIYVVKQGDYNQDLSELVKIDPFEKSVIHLQIPTTSIAKRENQLYLSYYDFNSGNSTISIFDCLSQTLTDSNWINSDQLTTLFGLFPFKDNKIIAFDAMNFTESGYLRFFNNAGQLTNSIQVGLNPNTIIHLK